MPGGFPQPAALSPKAPRRPGCLARLAALDARGGVGHGAQAPFSNRLTALITEPIPALRNALERVVDLSQLLRSRQADRCKRLIVLALHGLIREVLDERLRAVRKVAVDPGAAIQKLRAPAFQRDACVDRGSGFLWLHVRNHSKALTQQHSPHSYTPRL